MASRAANSVIRKASAKYPLSNILLDSPLPLRSSSKNRINIVSPGLCDDVLARLKPSLEKYKGCDILDINPGTALWSAKVHDLLQPRRHILMEPDKSFYAPFLNPLLETPGSRYRHVPYDILEGSSYQRILDDGLLPEQAARRASDANVGTINDSLLIIATIASQPIQKFRFGMTVANHLINCFCSPASRHSISMITQGLGAVRFLIWVNDKDKGSALPRIISSRDGYNWILEQSCHIHEVAGSGESAAHAVREHAVSLASAKRAATTMISSGIQLPPHRRDPLHQSILDAIATTPSHNFSLAETILRDEGLRGAELQPWQIELADLEEKLLQGQFKPPLPQGRRTLSESQDGQLYNDPRSARLRDLRNRARGFEALVRNDRLVADLLERKSLLEISMRRKGLGQSELDTAETELRELSSEIEAEFRDRPSKRISKILSMADDRKAFRSEPPLLAWDRREAEPLLVEKDEFFPQVKLSLLDFRPKETSLNSFDEDMRHIRRKFITQLFVNRTLPVTKALEGIAPGARDALIPAVPSLRDPSEGGCLEPEDLRVRMLTPKMVDELVKAFADWPFKPDASESGVFGALDAPGLTSNRFRA